jgi:hypothetical protein
MKKVSRVALPLCEAGKKKDPVCTIITSTLLLLDTLRTFDWIGVSQNFQHLKIDSLKFTWKQCIPKDTIRLYGN